jgi:hypothetical protein
MDARRECVICAYRMHTSCATCNKFMCFDEEMPDVDMMTSWQIYYNCTDDQLIKITKTRIQYKKDHHVVEKAFEARIQNDVTARRASLRSTEV